MATTFRKANVDFGQDDDEEDEVKRLSISQNSQELEQLFGQRQTQVRSLLSRGDNLQALAQVLKDPTVGNVSPELKERNMQLVYSVLNAVKPGEANLGSIDAVVLCKYIYKGMERPEEFNSAVLLGWHEKLTEFGGVGIVVRVLTDERTV